MAYKPSLWLLYIIHIITTYANDDTDTILTTTYGHFEGNQYEALNQGRISTINEWGTDHVIGLQIINWKSDSQTEFAGYGRGTIDQSCLSFNLSQTNDYIIGYKIYVDEVIYYIDEEDEDEQVPVLRDVIRGLVFYTRNGETYECVEDENVKNVYTNTYNDGYDFYYLSGWKIYSQRTINSIQFQFTKLSASESSPPTLNPTIFVTSQYNEENDIMEETMISSTNYFGDESTDFESVTPIATGSIATKVSTTELASQDEDVDIESDNIIYTTDPISQDEDNGDIESMEGIFPTYFVSTIQSEDSDDLDDEEESIDAREESEEDEDDLTSTTDALLIDGDKDDDNKGSDDDDNDDEHSTSTTTTTAIDSIKSTEEIKTIQTRIIHIYINRTKILKITEGNLEEIGIHDVFGGLPGTIAIICMMILLCCTIAICFGLTIFVCKRCIKEHKDQPSESLSHHQVHHHHAVKERNISIPMPRNNPVLTIPTIPTKHRNSEGQFKAQQHNKRRAGGRVNDGGLPITILKVTTSKSPHIRNNALDMSSIVNGSPSVPYTGEDVSDGETEETQQTDSESMYSTNKHLNHRRKSCTTTPETPQVGLVNPPTPEIDTRGEEDQEVMEEMEEEEIVYDDYEYEFEANLQPMPDQGQLGLFPIRSNTGHVD